MKLELLNPEANPFQTSEIRRIQDFYGVRYEDLWNQAKLKEIWLKAEEIKYCLENKDREFALKSTEWFELREWVTTTKRFRELQEYYGFTLKDTQSVEVLKTYRLKADDIEFITWIPQEDWVVETKTIPTKTKPKWKK